MRLSSSCVPGDAQTFWDVWALQGEWPTASLSAGQPSLLVDELLSPPPSIRLLLPTASQSVCRQPSLLVDGFSLRLRACGRCCLTVSLRRQRSLLVDELLSPSPSILVKAQSILSPSDANSVSELPGARTSLTAVCVAPFGALLITRFTRFTFAAGLLPDASPCPVPDWQSLRITP